MEPILSGLATAISGLNGATKVWNEAKIREAVAEANAALIDAQQHSLALLAAETASQKQIAALERKVRELEEKLSKVESWESLAACYTLKETFPNSLIFVREFDPAEGAKRGFREPTHWACSHCFDQGKRRIMRAKTTGAMAVECPECKSGAQFLAAGRQPPASVGTPRGW